MASSASVCCQNTGRKAANRSCGFAMQDRASGGIVHLCTERRTSNIEHKRLLRRLVARQPLFSKGTESQPSAFSARINLGDRIVHRNRTRQAGSLRDRLLAMAKLARQKAEACTDDQVRELLLRKAAQTERTAEIEEWINSPGAAPPE